MKNLIEKYLNGETNRQEEAELKAYFNGDQIDESLKEYQPLFQFFEHEKKLELDSVFDEKLFARINAAQTEKDELVEKYFLGETSQQEEAALKDYFARGPIEPNHQRYLPLFQYFNHEQAVETSSRFEEKLFRKLDHPGATIIPMRARGRRLLQVAAVAAVFLAAHFVFNKPAEPEPPIVNWAAYEINDEQLAYEETVKALKLLSSKINKGKKKTVLEVSKSEPISKYLN